MLIPKPFVVPSIVGTYLGAVLFCVGLAVAILGR